MRTNAARGQHDQSSPITTTFAFRLLGGLLGLVLATQIIVVLYHDDITGLSLIDARPARNRLVVRDERDATSSSGDERSRRARNSSPRRDDDDDDEREPRRVEGDSPRRMFDANKDRTEKERASNSLRKNDHARVSSVDDERSQRTGSSPSESPPDKRDDIKRTETSLKTSTTKLRAKSRKARVVSNGTEQNVPADRDVGPPIPFLPARAPVPNGEKLMKDLLDGKPTIAGIVHLFTTFLNEIHDNFKELADNKELNYNQVYPDGSQFPDKVLEAYANLYDKHFVAFEAKYRNKPIFPVREDDSVFISVAAYREHLLAQTLKEIFDHATAPEKVFVGVVVQNCFGVEYTCRTGVEVVGTGPNGRPKTKVSDRPPDVNGIEQFCAPDSEHRRYCDSGQVRVLYVSEPESFGPAAARYYASKLWGGETYYVQVDSHLQFAQDWDGRYITDMKLAKSYPKVILSSYPPGFSNSVGTSNGQKLCSCVFSTSDIEHNIIRVNTGAAYRGGEEHPTQIPFMAAGFFFTRAEFLVDVPFDPMLPWVFMGEEIALSMRAWTHGWDMYAPRKNNIAHQYRPGRMGLPKFWETVGRTFHRPGPGFNTKLQNRLIERVKNMVGYPESTAGMIRSKGFSTDILLKGLEYYGLGEVRPREEYLELAGLDMENKMCKHAKLCDKE